jgi:Lrp/AsnC family transcriptional regulator, leucine-responsive regulatory protein
LDPIDRKILALYQKDTRRIADSIGEEVGLSAAAVQRRLKRLRETGVIKSELALLDHLALGVPITCVVTVSMAAGPSRLEQFKKKMRSDPAVQQCYQVTGSADLVLIVMAQSMEAYADFARSYFEAGAEVARFETHVVLDRVRVGLSTPIPL